jgi:hypothetical protein
MEAAVAVAGTAAVQGDEQPDVVPIGRPLG